jgi:hypothetical protein
MIYLNLKKLHKPFSPPRHKYIKRHKENILDDSIRLAETLGPVEYE